MLTVGATHLRELLSPKLMSAAELAEKLGVTRQSVSNWVTGRAKPDPNTLARIEDLTGVPMREWTQPAAEQGEAADEAG